jgi:hypothetical protein
VKCLALVMLTATGFAWVLCRAAALSDRLHAALCVCHCPDGAPDVDRELRWLIADERPPYDHERDGL